MAGVSVLGTRALKRFFTFILVLCLMAVAAAVVAPSFINWNAYRGELAALLSRAAGRQVAINGALEMALLPSPHLNARDVRIANIEGASAPEMARIGEIRMQVATGPLFAGRIAISSLLLVEPVIELETGSHGRGNWEFKGLSADGGPRADGRTGLPLQFTFDRIAIANGTLTWRGAEGRVERLEKLNTQIALADIGGPVDLQASASYRDRPFAVDLSLGARRPENRLPFNARISLADEAGQISLAGVADTQAKTAEGRMKMAGPDAGAFAAALAGRPVGPLPAWDFAVESPVELSTETVDASGLSIRMGEVNATGAASLALGDVPSLKAVLDVASVNLDEILDDGEKAERGDRASGEDEAGPAMLPKDLNAEIDIGARILRWKGGIVRDVELLSSLRSGVLTIERGAAQLPGGTTMTLSGRAFNSDSGIQLDGDLAAISDNLRAALLWAGVEEGSLPPDRLRAFSYTSRIAVRRESVNLTDIKARFDATRAAGAAVIARRKRPSFGVNLELDQIDLDAYLDNREDAAAEGAAGGGAESSGESVFGAFDANFDLSVANLAWEDKSVSAVRLDSQLFQGKLTLRELSVGDFGGARLEISGTLADLAGEARADLDIDLEGRDSESFVAFLGVGSGPVARRLGPFSISGHAKGNLEKSEITAVMAAAGSEATLAGALSELDKKPFLDLAVSLSSPDGDRMIALVLPARRPGNSGPLEARLHMSGSAEALALRDIAGRLGETEFSGSVDLELSGNRPDIDADIATGTIMLDRLFPETTDRPGSEAPAVRGSARWSREPFDFDGLRDFDMRLALRSEGLVRREVAVTQTLLEAVVADGTATIENFSGKIFGGTVEMSGRLSTAGDVPAIEGVVAARNVSSKGALEAATDFARFKGPVSMDLSLNGSGRNEFQLISSLSGSGSISGKVEARLKEEERAQAGVGAMLGMLFGDKVRELGAAGDAIAVLIRAFAVEPADLSGDFDILDGVVRTDNLLLDGSGARARTAGAADLANWTIDSNTVMHRQQDTDTPYLTLALRGTLDRPDVRTGGAWLQRPPKAESREPTGPAETGGEAAPEPQSEPEPKKPPKPEDFIRDILESIQ